MSFNPSVILPNMKKEDVGKSNGIYLVKDHIPDIEDFVPYRSIDDGDTIDYFLDHDAKNSLFVFDYYLGFEDYKNNGFFYPGFFIGCIDQYKNRLDSVTLDENWERKIIPVNCLLNKERIHRILISNWLFKNFSWNENLIYSQSWVKSKSRRQRYAKQLFLNCCSTHEKNDFSQLPENWFSFRNENASSYQYSDNVEIFNEVLYPRVFSKTALSIVAEPDFWINACAVTEKYINAITGLTIPIVTGYKIYEKLDDIGFDTFEDIINTKYQYEKNPTKRIIDMMESNKEVLSAAMKIIQDSEVQRRLLKNRDHLFDIDSIKILSRKNLNSDNSENRFRSHIDDILNYFRDYNCSW